MRLHLEGESYDKLHLEDDNSWGKYLLRSSGVGRIISRRGINSLPDFITQSGPSPNRQPGEPSRECNPGARLTGKRYAKGFGVSEAPATKVIVSRERRFSMARSSPLRPFNRLVRFTSPLPIVSPPSAPLSIRSKPVNLADQTLTQARGYLGAPYRRGGSLKTGYSTDCSGFVQFIYKKANIDLPRSSSEQARVGIKVAHSLDFALLRPGDLLLLGFWATGVAMSAMREFTWEKER